MELPDTVQLVIVGGQPVRMVLGRPTGAGVRTDRERAELVESKHPIWEAAGDMLDTGQLGIPVGVGGLLPGLGPLKGDAVLAQDLAKAFPADSDLATAAVVRAR